MYVCRAPPTTTPFKKHNSHFRPRPTNQTKKTDELEEWRVKEQEAHQLTPGKVALFAEAWAEGEAVLRELAVSLLRVFVEEEGVFVCLFGRSKRPCPASLTPQTQNAKIQQQKTNKKTTPPITPPPMTDDAHDDAELDDAETASRTCESGEDALELAVSLHVCDCVLFWGSFFQPHSLTLKHKNPTKNK